MCFGDRDGYDKGVDGDDCSDPSHEVRSQSETDNCDHHGESHEQPRCGYTRDLHRYGVTSICRN